MNPLKRIALLLYGVYAWTTFLLLGSFTLLLLLLLPGLHVRRVVGGLCARAWLYIAAIRISFLNRHLLPSEPCVVVANHSSYIDGVILKAILPTRFAFVIKKEMVRVPLAGLLLRRIGAEFVDRFNRHSGAMDARRLMRAAVRGRSMVFFPEGTFASEPGLARFHGGAFTIAARAQLPVVPIAIRGARQILRGGALLPRPGRVEIEVLPLVAVPTLPSLNAIADAQRTTSRARILAALNEPDLDSDGVASLARRGNA